MTTETKQIHIPEKLERVGWATMADTPFTPEEQFELVCRYCDSQDYAKAYRRKRNQKMKLLKSRVAELAKEAGVSVEEYLERV